jgi:hypothetical protein
MSKQIKALNMAIEALEDFSTQYARLEPIINACKEALEQPAQEPVSKTAERDYNFMRDLAIGTEDMLNEILAAKPIGYVDAEQFRRWEALKGTQYESAERTMLPFSTTPYKDDLTDCSLPVYTYPHEWQGLTDDEIDAIIKEKDGVFGAVVRAIEQALKEKNT